MKGSKKKIESVEKYTFYEQNMQVVALGESSEQEEEEEKRCEAEKEMIIMMTDTKQQQASKQANLMKCLRCRRVKIGEREKKSSSDVELV